MKIFAWDFHGTLEQGVEVGFWHILKKLAREWRIKENFELMEVRRLYGTSIADYLRHFFPRCSDEIIKQMMARLVELQDEGHLNTYVKAEPGAIEVLVKIKKAGHKNIVVSNSRPGHIVPLIEIVGLKDLIDKVYAIDRHFTTKMIDPVAEKTKILKKIAEKNRLKNGGLIVIGDRASDINAGLAAGALTYQFLRRSFPIDKTQAHYKIYDLAEILREI